MSAALTRTARPNRNNRSWPACSARRSVAFEMRSIVRRATGENYREYLAKLAAADGEASDRAALQSRDRKRKKKVSNKDWVNPHDREAEITKMKDGRTRLAYKAEQAVDLDTGAIVATTAHPGASGDTTSIQQTVPAAGEAVAEQMTTAQDVNEAGVEEVVADKGDHSGATLEKLVEWGVRSYVSEPERGRRKRLLRQRGEKLERPSGHQFETGAMRRLRVRGLDEVKKKLLLQAAACNLALLLRTKHGAGTPRGLAEAVKRLCEEILELLGALQAPAGPGNAPIGQLDPPSPARSRRPNSCLPLSEAAV